MRTQGRTTRSTPRSTTQVDPDAEAPLTAWARSGVARLLERPGVHRIGLALVEGGGRQLRFTASDRLALRGGADGASDPWCLVDAYDDVPLNRVVRTGEPVLGSLDQLEPAYAAFVGNLRATTTRALAAAPILVEGRVVGGVLLYYDAPPVFDAEHLTTLRAVGDELGSALRRAERPRAGDAISLADATVPPGARTAVHEVPRTHTGVAGARSFLEHTLRAWEVDPGVVEDAVLCLSELVTNALVHSETGCSVRVVLEQDVLTVTVRDGGAAAASATRASEDVLRVHGRGLQIVDALAVRWGSDLDAVGMTVWFSLELTARP